MYLRVLLQYVNELFKYKYYIVNVQVFSLKRWNGFERFYLYFSYCGMFTHQSLFLIKALPYILPVSSIIPSQLKVQGYSTFRSEKS